MNDQDYIINGLADQLNEALVKIDILTEELQLIRTERDALMNDIYSAFHSKDGFCSICAEYKDAVGGACSGMLDGECFMWRGVNHGAEA